MIKLQTKEHLIYFMQSGMMKLGNYDLKFVQNLCVLINQKKFITSNQDLLLTKLIQKYKKQFGRHSYDVSFLNNLKWTTNIIQSAPEHTQAYIQIKDNRIYVKCPFNKKFINDLRHLTINPLKWNPVEKNYEAPFSTYSTKIILKLLTKNYSTINYCEVTKRILSEVNSFKDNLIWEPTLVNKNNMLLIGGYNTFLNEALQFESLNLNYKTIHKLTEYGIQLSEELVTNKKIKFVSQHTSLIDIEDINETVDWLHELDCDCILFSGLTKTNVKQDLYKKLTVLGIDYYNHSDVLFTTNSMVINKYKFIASIHFSSIKIHPSLLGNYQIRKVVKVNNNNPIQIK